MEISHGEALSIVAGLIATIGALWYEVKANNRRIREDYKELKQEHKDCNESIKTLHGKIERISGEYEGVEKTSRKVIEELRNKNNCNYKNEVDR